AMDDALETSIERLRDHLRRPHARKRNHLTENAAYTVNQTDPTAAGQEAPGGLAALAVLAAMAALLHWARAVPPVVAVAAAPVAPEA
ncbi:hypothetical protein OSI00_17030, partial [Mycobacterium ulcerans]